MAKKKTKQVSDRVAKKFQFCYLNDNILGLNIYWIQCDRKTYRSAVLIEFSKVAPEKKPTVQASFEVYYVDDVPAGVIWLSTKSISDAAHESLHAVHWHLQTRGLWLADASEEIYAYYIQHLVEQIGLSFKKGMTV